MVEAPDRTTARAPSHKFRNKPPRPDPVARRTLLSGQANDVIRALTLLLLYQLGGETLSRAFALAVPGPVIGLAALFVTLLLVPRLADTLRATTRGLLGHLSLLFVPAGVGVVAHLDTLAQYGPGLILALVLSTVLALLVSVGTFLLVVRLSGGADD